jgi:hypothetical protein
MLSHVSHTPIDHYGLGAKVFRAGRHESSPASRIESFGLLNVHDATLFVVVYKMLVQLRRRLVAHLHHLHRDGMSHDPSVEARGEHANSIEKAAVWVLEPDEGVANLEFVS